MLTLIAKRNYVMRNLAFATVLFIVISCSDSEVGDLTGEELNYTLFSGSEFGYEGDLLIQEKKDGQARITIELSGPEGEAFFPVHLHYNSFTTPDAEVAALLSPVNARNGISITDLDFLSDDSRVTYKDMVSFDGHVKIHLDDGVNQDVILAFTNIGANKEMIDGEAAQCNGPN